MAEKRMFAKTIIDSDAFLDMSLSAQALYFHLSMRGDDEGFVNNPKKIQRMIGASDDDAKILVAKKFIIPFESGIVVIKHWKIHNYIRRDRLVETKYKEERSLLELDENGAYTSIANDEQLALSAKDKRKHAYEVSSLPYSFEYKIRHAFTGHECPVCGCTMTHENNLVQPTIQHNIPISKGGEHELGNISVICRSCNTSIRDKETGELNSREVAETWDKICELESHGIDWFKNTTLLCQSSDGQVTDISQPNGSIDKNSIDKSRLVESRNEQTDELSSLIEFCNNNVEILTPFKCQMLEGYVEDYGIEWVQRGLEKVAGLDRTKQNVKYLGGVLKGWKKDGVPKPWEDNQESKQEPKKLHDDVGEYELINGYKVYL